jgi:Xaa-Pro aminopeptidase
MSHYHIGEMGGTEDSPLGHIDFDRMLRDKLVRLRERMKHYDLSAIICLTELDVGYSTNIPPIFPGASAIGGNRYAVVPLEGEPVGFEEANTAYVLKDQLKNIKVEYAVPGWGGPNFASAPEAQEFLTRSFAEQIYSVLKNFGLAGEKIGIDAFVPQINTQLEKTGLNLSLDGTKAINEAREIKTPLELECIRSVASIVDGCFATLAKNLRVGVSEREIWGKCIAYAVENGVTVNGGFIDSGPHTWPKDNTRQASTRRIRPGDVVYADFFNFGFFGYRSCYYRSFSVGPPSKEVRETYKRVYDWMCEALEAVKPGATTMDVVKNWPDDSELWGKRAPFIGSELEKLSTFWMNMGHGIGLSLYEPPFFWKPVASRWPQKLKQNTAIALETLDGTPDGKAGVRIEEMMIVNDSGCEVISKWPIEEITEVPLY